MGEEDCEENFQKSCFIEYKKVASEEAVTFCHTPIILEGDGEEVCQTVYESACTTQVPGNEECFDRKETVIQEVPEETCNLEPQRICKHVTKLVPLLKPTQECVDIPKEVCSRSRTNPRK